MTQPNTTIKCSKKGLVLIQDGGPSQTTKNKVERVAEFLTAHKDAFQQMDNHRELLDSLKEKLIREAEGNPGLIKRVNRIGFKQGEGVSPAVSIVDSKDFVSKPVKVVKFGLIIEQSHLLTNDAMRISAINLLSDGIPIIVNRDFLVAQRQSFTDFKVFHQKEGNFSIIFPKTGETPVDFGFNTQELVQGSVLELPELKETKPSKDLEKILLKENDTNKFYRLGFLTGHGSPAFEEEGYIIGLPTSEFHEVQNTLKKKGMKFGIIETCYGGGGNLNAIQQTPYPVLLNSSSEIPSISSFMTPSQTGILEYAYQQLQKNPSSALKLDETTILGNERVHSILKGQEIKNAPQIILPTSKPFLITPDTPEHKSFKRLQKPIFDEIISLEGRGGLVSPGGTKNHLLNEVSTPSSLHDFAKETFSLLKLSQSRVEKGFFIKKIGDFSNIMLFASKNEKCLIYSMKGKFYYASDDVNDFEVLKEFAISKYITYFAKTLEKKGEKGEVLFKKFQKVFFDEEIKSPFFQILTMIVNVHLYPENEQGLNLSILSKDLSPEQKKLIFETANSLNLSSLKNHIEEIFIPNIIQNIKQNEEEKTIQWIETQLETCKDPTSFLNGSDATGKTTLYWALHTEQKELVNFLLTKMIEVDQAESPWWDSNVFIVACQKGNPKVFNDLFKLWGIQVNQLQPRALQIALEGALLSRNKDNALYFLQNTKVDAQELLSDALDSYVTYEDMEFITFLLDQGAHPNTHSKSGSLPLISLCSNPPSQKQLEIFELLLKKGADVDLADQNGDTPLLKAMASKNFTIIEALIKAGASIGFTSFEYAMRDKQIMEFILKTCSLDQLEFKKLDGNRLLGWFEKGHVKIYQLFLDAMIEQCPAEPLKPFYSALQKGALKDISKEDIAKAWDYLPPPLILTWLKNPSDELIQAVVDQLPYANMKQMTGDETNLIYIHLLPFIKEENQAMQLQIISCTRDEEQEGLREYFKL